jgi:hypothetical protein
MTTIVIISIIAVAGAYLRWATGPVLIAYQVGRQVERMLGRPAQMARVFHAANGIGRRDRERQRPRPSVRARRRP